MAGNQARNDLAELLGELKSRSGLSYQVLGRKVVLSKSAVHRYCIGSAVPPDFGTVERIARATGADQVELHRLYSLWARAIAAAKEAEATVAQEVGGPEPEAVAAAEPARPAPARRRRITAPTTAIAVLLTVFAVVNGLSGSLEGEPDSGEAQWISGPNWTLPAERVSDRLFGVTINSTTGNMPGFDIGAVRLWDSGTLWARLQPRRDSFDWTVLDRHVDGARAAGLPVLFVLGGTPGWAAPAGPRAPYPEDARAVPPDDLADWDVFVRALVERYQGRIEAYELWVLANDPRFYNGTVETLVEMTRRASLVIREVDPAATVVCPGMGNLWTAEGRDVLRRFAELRGYDHCDVAGIKLHQRSAADAPETMLEITGTVDQILHAAGVHPRVWNTGTMYSIPLQGQLDEATARAYAVRFYLVGLLARETYLERMYFYNWGGVKIPVVLQADGGSPTPAARAVEALQAWVTNAEVQSCGHGEAVDLPSNAWKCDFIVTEGARHYGATIAWTHEGTATVTAESDIARVRRLDGSSTSAPAGSSLVLTEEPVLIERNA